MADSEIDIDTSDLQKAMDALRAAAEGATMSIGGATQRQEEDTRQPKVDIGADVAKAEIKFKSAGKKFTDALTVSGKALLNFYDAVGQSGDVDALESVIDGAAGAVKSLGTSVDEFGNKVGESGEETSEKLGVFGQVLNKAGVGAGAVAAFSKVLLKEMELNKEAYHELSKFGVGAADGITGMQRQWQNSQLKLDVFAGAMEKSSQAMALLRGSADAGAEDFSKVLGAVSMTDKTLRRLGMTQEEMADVSSTYLEIETKLGRGGGLSVAQLTEKTKDYANQLDTISRITGETRQSVAERDKRAMEDDRWVALLAGKSDEEQKQLRLQNQIYESQSAETAANFRKFMAAGGTAIDEGSAKFARSHARSALAKTPEDFGTALNAESTALQVRAKNQAYMEQGSDFVIGYAEIQKAANHDYARDIASALKQNDEVQAGHDEQTEAMVDSEANMQKMFMEYHKQLTKFLPVFTELTAKSTEGLTAVDESMTNLAHQMGIYVDHASDLASDVAKQVRTAWSGATSGGTTGGDGGASGSSIIDQAKSMLGKTETGNREELINYLNENSGTQMKDVVGDTYAWCARYVNATLSKQGIQGTKSASAASFKNFGEKVWDPTMGGDTSGVKAGDIIVIGRSGGSGSHVAFVESVDAATGRIKTIGGNQGGVKAGGGGVTESSVDISQVQAIRRAPGATQLAKATPLSSPQPIETTPITVATKTIEAEPTNVVKAGLGQVMPFPEAKPTNVEPTTVAMETLQPPKPVEATQPKPVEMTPTTVAQVETPQPPKPVEATQPKLAEVEPTTVAQVETPQPPKPIESTQPDITPTRAANPNPAPVTGQPRYATQTYASVRTPPYSEAPDLTVPGSKYNAQMVPNPTVEVPPATAAADPKQTEQKNLFDQSIALLTDMNSQLDAINKHYSKNVTTTHAAKDAALT